MSVGAARSCAELSVQLAEPLAGTAPEHVSRTLLVPHRGAIAREPLESAGLLIPREDIEAALRATPGSRFHLFAREPQGAFASSILVARTDRSARSLHRFDLEAVTGPQALTQMLHEPERGAPVEGPLHLVCTHGKRDACCARLGTALHLALRAAVGERVLKTSHLGGHRFAPVVHTFPQGFCFGRVEAGDVRALDEAAARGEVYDPDRLRGVFPYDGAEQAALAVHLQAGGTLGGVRVSREGELVTVTDPSLVHVYRVHRHALTPRPLSCGASPGEASSFEVRAREIETR
jgi:hypothetical protein